MRTLFFSSLALTALQLGLAPSLPFPGWRHPQRNLESQLAKSKYRVLHMPASSVRRKEITSRSKGNGPGDVRGATS